MTSSYDKNLFVRGCVTNPSAAGSFYYELRGMTPPKKVKGWKAPPVKQDFRVIATTALDEKHVPPGWMREILSQGGAAQVLAFRSGLVAVSLERADG